MLTFLALTLQMGHTVQGRLDNYWTKMEQLCCPFYGQMMVHARYYHILRFLHFTDNNRNGVDRTNYRMWKIWDLFEILWNFSKFYNASEHLALDEVIVKFEGRVVFKQYITKKHKRNNVTISTGLASVPRNGDVACVQWGVWRKMFKCVKCDVALCVDWNFFMDYNTKNNF